MERDFFLITNSDTSHVLTFHVLYLSACCYIACFERSIPCFVFRSLDASGNTWESSNDQRGLPMSDSPLGQFESWCP